ncbi:MAG: spore germination protein [Oscillospiraceae bacterium]|nr:spore germination protein [Oscillospiraceae bacterium]
MYREIFPGGAALPPVTVCWLDGMISGADMSEDVLRPLTSPDRFATCRTTAECLNIIMYGGVYSYSVKKRAEIDDVVSDLANGFCAIVFDCLNVAITFEVKSTLNRSISEPNVERSTKGGKDAFVENIRINTSLIRRRIRDPDLKITETTVGRKSGTRVALLYVQGVANSDIITEAKRRINAIDIDGLIAAENFEQYMTDAPYSLFPQVIHTERPDKLAIELLAGRIAFLIDGLPFAFVLPASFSEFMRVAEDKARNYVISSFLTLLRYAAVLLAALFPALMVAVAMYHQEMIPEKLLLSMIGAKQEVPFSSATEILLMLLSFELLQEAGTRLPKSLGDTVSIIGALIVGQAAVDAKIVSPIAIIIVAAAGIAGYAQPSQDLGSAVRIIRLGAVVAAIVLGLYGVMLLICFIIWHLCTIESFGIAYTSPFTDGGFGNILRAMLRPPVKKEKYRPRELKGEDKRNQK